jgi:hypothetical protein
VPHFCTAKRTRKHNCWDTELSGECTRFPSLMRATQRNSVVWNVSNVGRFWANCCRVLLRRGEKSCNCFVIFFDCTCVTVNFGHKIFRCWLRRAWIHDLFDFIFSHVEYHTKVHERAYQDTDFRNQTKYCYVPTHPLRRKVTDCLPLPDTVTTVYSSSWWWVNVSPETCRAVCRE